MFVFVKLLGYTSKWKMVCKMHDNAERSHVLYNYHSVKAQF